MSTPVTTVTHTMSGNPVVLELTDNPDIVNKIHRVPLGTRLLLDRCPKLQGAQCDVWCVGPLGARVEAEGGVWCLDTAGPYHLSFVHPYSLLHKNTITMTVLVDPVIQDCETDPGLKLDMLAVQSHLMKCCGKLENWASVFQVSVESGYNMVHLTPVQQLGVSRSAYSVHSHLSVSDTLGIVHPDHTAGDAAARYRYSLDTLSTALQHIHTDTGLYFLSDVVWNHVSICNPDIREHPDSYYNLHNTPNLIPAYLVDLAIAEFSDQVESGQYPAVTQLKSYADVEVLVRLLRQHLVAVSGRITELYRISVPPELDLKCSGPDARVSAVEELQDKPLGDVIRALWHVDYGKRERAGTLDYRTLNHVLFNRGMLGEEARREELTKHVQMFNTHRVPEIVSDIFDRVVGAVRGTVNYRFVEENGPRLELGPGTALLDRYFHIPVLSLREELRLDVYTVEHAQRVMSCNGWTMGDSISDMSTTKAYLHRDVVIWGDSVKLRYGTGPADSPWLWQYMERYTTDMARLFHGFRIDNCHNTPLHVGEELLRAARRVRPNLYVVAELFTGSEAADCTIINRMGINSCIRELSQSRSPQHLGELAYHYGESKPCGSFLHVRELGNDVTTVTDDVTTATDDITTATDDVTQATYLHPSIPHAMLMEQTHDNPCPFDQHPILNVLAMSGVMIAAKCSIGSNRGYDELVPYHVHVVNEERLYLDHNSKVTCAGIKAVKRALIELHRSLETGGYHETFVDQVTRDMIIVTRHSPVTCEKVLVVIATQFSADVRVSGESWESAPSITLPGGEVAVLLEVELQTNTDTPEYTQHPAYITGLESVDWKVRRDVVCSELVRTVQCEDGQIQIQLKLNPGSLAVLKIKPAPVVAQSIAYCNANLLSNCKQVTARLAEVCSGLTLLQLNYVLYRSGPEERVDGCGGVYNVPGLGDLPYAGLQGFLSVLEEIRAGNKMGHALCRNLTEGWWCAEYTVHRLCLKEGSRPLGLLLQGIFHSVRDIPNYMRPKIFDKILCLAYRGCEKQIGRLIPTYPASTAFQQQLILTSVQLFGEVKDTGIPVDPDEGGHVGSLAAGLPHFSHGFMRCWGRDTFIALPGLLIATGRLDVASELVVGFARTLRHGLIPNLLSEGGHAPRYNCRDAAWWWCRAVHLLWVERPQILHHTVHRMFGPDDKPSPGYECTVLDVVQEILTKHAQGISFVEHGAGPGLDEHLKQAGFHIRAGVDRKTGFVRGGSGSNCGTWMDKVGSSDIAGNRGRPATPRDGSAVELVALCYQTVSWMSQLHRDNKSPHVGCDGVDSERWLYAEWAAKIAANFEESFWLEEGCHVASINQSGGYYRDTVGGSAGRGAELRPNQAVALVVAPGLMSASHREAAVGVIGRTLAGPLGLCTLSPHDPDYIPYYDNTNNSEDYRTAHGFNYHQGPEWVWCMGFYLRAKLSVAPDIDHFTAFLQHVLAPHRVLISTSPYRGLTELTNKDGEHCAGSCPTQAWSSACLLELFNDIQSRDTVTTE